ncbi:RCC1 domain-containing protein [Legionella cardiaca]|uniref:Regulator of chromosome condensation (RCC1) repeat protein n=1 Tax=Legionella cardiaca TaxID=1071983 RepID=A0ABY8ASN1_9GAMM|nr:hypothetical protein [Legionella cardiaca]WED43684.1 hypothetical protein PXX05_02590 [Legionella cardiaca]
MPSNASSPLLTLPSDILCYLALNYLDYHSAVILFRNIIYKQFTLENPRKINETRLEHLETFTDATFKSYKEVCRKLSSKLPKIIGGNYACFYFSPAQEWFVWGSGARQYTGNERLNFFPKKLILSLTKSTSQLWQKSELNIIDIVSGNSQTFFLTTDGKVYRQGNNFPKERQPFKNKALSSNTELELIKELVGEQIIELALGDNHVLALTNNGQVYSWGLNDAGQLGLGHTDYQSTPQLITHLENITHIFAGSDVSFCISEKRQVYAFGANICGNLGLGNIPYIFKPQLIPALTDKKIISVACKGNFYTLFLAKSGEVFSTGVNNEGALGLGNVTSVSTPTVVNSLPRIKKIINEDSLSLCLDEQGEMYFFGKNILAPSYFKKTIPVTHYSTPQPLKFVNDTGIASIAIGDFHLLCLTKSKEIYTFSLKSSLINPIFLKVPLPEALDNSDLPNSIRL